MSVQTLDELKAENAKNEKDPPQTENENENPQGVTETPNTNSEDTTPPSEGEGAEAEVDDDDTGWMDTGEETPSENQDRKFTGSDIAAAKAKLKAKLRKRDDELEALRAEVEALKKGNGHAPVSNTPNSARPKRNDFDNADDPDEAFAEALFDWKMAQQNQQANAQTQNYQRKQAEQQLNAAVDDHYTRAAKLATQSKITPEAYQASDLRVRTAIEGIFPNLGDAVTDGLIANLGEGSEKVFYNLGVNPTRLAELERRLREDKSGLKAAIYLGELRSSLAAPINRRSNAPAPAPTANGDVNASSNDAALKKRYLDAHRKGDQQAAFNARRDARKAGVDTSQW